MLEKKGSVGFRYALKGLQIAWTEERNFRIELALATLALALSFFLDISTTEWLIVLVLIGLVLSAEMLNTSLEEFCDMVKGDPDPHIAKIKDLAAAGVLVASSTALVAGLIIFVPKIF